MAQQGAAAVAAEGGTGTSASVAAPSSSKGAQGLTYVMAAAGRLWSTALRLEATRAEGTAERNVRLEAAPAEAIATLDHTGRLALSCSPSGRSVSVVWPHLRAYTVYRWGGGCCVSGTWRQPGQGGLPAASAGVPSPARRCQLFSAFPRPSCPAWPPTTCQPGAQRHLGSSGSRQWQLRGLVLHYACICHHLGGCYVRGDSLDAWRALKWQPAVVAAAD